MTGQSRPQAMRVGGDGIARFLFENKRLIMQVMFG